MTLTKDNEQILNNAYYDKRTGFISAPRLYKKLKEEGHKFTLKEVQEFIKSQEVHEVFEKADETKILFPITSESAHDYQSDLAFMPQLKQKNKGYSILLTIINVMTRKLYAYPLKNKTEVTEKFEEFINIVKKINNLTTDNGSEYVNKKFSELMKKHNITHYTNQAGDHKHMGLIERSHRTLKGLLNRIMRANKSVIWVDFIDDAVDNYNNSFHRGIKTTPNKMTLDDVKENHRMDVHKTNRLLDEINIKEGDEVRIKLTKKQFDKENQNWSTETYIVDSMDGLKYKIKDKDGKFQRKKYAHDELKIIKSNSTEEDIKFDDEVKEVKKQHKTDNIIKHKEGLDKKDIIEDKFNIGDVVKVQIADQNGRKRFYAGTIKRKRGKKHLIEWKNGDPSEWLNLDEEIVKK